MFDPPRSDRTRRSVANQAKYKNYGRDTPRRFTIHGPTFRPKRFPPASRVLSGHASQQAGTKQHHNLRTWTGFSPRRKMSVSKTPKARRGRKPLERHNRIVHLAKTECPIPAGSKLACVPPHSRSFSNFANPPPALQRCRQWCAENTLAIQHLNSAIHTPTRFRALKRAAFRARLARKLTAQARTHHDKHSASCFGMQLAYLTSTVATPSNFFLIVSASSLVAFSFKGLGAPSTRSFASFRPSEVTSRTALIVLILFAP
jgi:hypothetical protein